MFSLEILLNKNLALLLTGRPNSLPSPAAHTFAHGPCAHVQPTRATPFSCPHACWTTAAPPPAAHPYRRQNPPGPHAVLLHVTRSRPGPPSFLRMAPPMPDPSPHFPFSFSQKPSTPSVSPFRSTAVFGTETRRHLFLPPPQSLCTGLERQSAASIAGFAPKHRRCCPPR
jgi:hypothetical protein